MTTMSSEDATPSANMTFEASDGCLLTRAGSLLRDGLSGPERERLHALLTHALWAASFRPVVTSFVLERLTLPLAEQAQGEGSHGADAAPSAPPR